MKNKKRFGILLCCLIFQACTVQYTVLNKGVSGNNSADLARRSEKDVLTENPDLVILMVGTNDMINPNKMLSYHDFEQNLQHLIDQFDRSALVLMGPPPVDEGYLFQRHKKSLFSSPPNARIDSAVKIIKAMAERKGCGFIDLNQVFRKQGSPSRERASLIVNKENLGKEDGVHPTSAGYQLIAKEVFAFLKRHCMLKRRMKIICFGDSITYGAFMKGAGTSEGNTYPSWLRKLLVQSRTASQPMK